MSLAAAVRSVRARQNQRSVVSAVQEAAQSEQDKNYLERLLTWIPTDVVATWGAFNGAVQPSTQKKRWVILVGAVVILLLYLAVLLAVDRKNAVTPKQPLKKRQIAAVIIIMTASFAIWALAIPGSPLSSAGIRIAVGVAIIEAMFLPRIAQLFNVEPIS
jgi:quinol-cytochrome oxidoreductase complex cytochrome b subunit